MKIDHLAIWTNQPVILKDFYLKYFNGRAGEKYYNPVKQFTSYFLSFDDGPRLELMQLPNLPEQNTAMPCTGLTHFAVSVGSREQVDALTKTIRRNGYRVAGEPRWTGDGYNESVILDPDNNRVEITI